MTLYYPDVSGYQAGVSFAGVPIAMVKATEGTDLTNSDFAPAKARAKSAGAYFCAYHFLREGNAVAQAQYAHSVVGSTPLMLDMEQEALASGTSNPTVQDAADFVTEYRALGGVVYLLYLPKWYWQDIGSPSLAALQQLGLMLVTSDYTTYSTNGSGWNGYGGMTVLVWQYSESGSLNGVSPVDWNAFKAGTLMDFEAYVTTGAASGTEPTIQEGDTGAAVTLAQQRLNVWGAKITVDGDFGAGTLAAVKAFQTREKLTVDGVVGPATWAALEKSPTPPAPVLVAYPAPAGLGAKTIDLHVSWTEVKIPSPDADAGEAVTSYSVQAVGMNGEVYASETVTGTTVVLTGLVPGWTYTIKVWCNGGPIAPTSATLKITV